ncbi:hypothetical protein ACFQUX_29175 [Pantoea stewartii]
MKVAEEIISPANRKLVLKWETYGNGKRLTSVSDESRTLLNIKHTTAMVTFSIWPGSTEEHSVLLKFQNDFLTSVMNKHDSAELSWALGYTNKILTVVSGPTGLKELVNYSATGHRFPTGGPGQTVPYVISYKQSGKDGQLLRHLSYEFSDKNFLGYGGSNQYSWIMILIICMAFWEITSTPVLKRLMISKVILLAESKEHITYRPVNRAL